MSTPRQTTRPPPAGPIDPALGTACRRVIEGALAIVPGEAVLFVIDRDHADVGEALANAALARTWRWPTTLVLEDLGSRPFGGLPREVRDAMENTQASVLLIDIARHPEIPLRHEMINAAGSRACGTPT